MGNKISYRRNLPSGFVRAGTFQTKLCLQVIQELNRRKIIYRTEEVDGFATALYVLKNSSAEAAEILNEIKRKNKRIRL